MIEFKSTNPPRTDLSERINGALDRVWTDFVEEASQQIKNIMLGILMSKVPSWGITSEHLELYPFLSNKSKFVENYVSTIQVKFFSRSMHISADPDRLMEQGIPVGFPELLEFGSLSFPSIPHFSETIEVWRQKYEAKLMKKWASSVVREVS